MFDLISIGSISIDLFFKSDTFTFSNNRFQLAVGGKYFAPYFHTGIGGGGTNVAIGAAKRGLKVAVCGLIGENPFKKMIVDHLDGFNISHKFSKIVNDYFNISTILLTEKGERTIIHHSTPHQKLFDRFFTKDL
ncbi:carbohydrate kinase family protein, partial [Candidatus Roizmanbacteria bacterium]|nr:carbohydrate kinase family protein [Candidatus Roizmanbacteria bacterium]